MPRPAFRTRKIGAAGQESYKASLELMAMNREGLVGDVAMTLSDMRVPIYAMSARMVDNGRAAMSLTVGIASTEHLNNVLNRLRHLRDVILVTRV